MDGAAGLEITEKVDYSALQSQILKVINTLLQKQKLRFEEKLIIENALSLWVGCLLHRGQLFQEFMEPKDASFNPEQFLLAGLLFCPYE